MKKILLITIFFLTSCTSNISKNEINFTDEMTFNEFKMKLEEYAINNPYPKIDG